MAQHTLVVLPGAWGNKIEEIVRWWFSFVIEFFEALGWKIVVVTYRGRTLGQYVESALSQVGGVPNGAFAIGYSMGAQVARGMCEKRPGLFRKVALIGGLERSGVRLWPFLKGLIIALWPFLRALRPGGEVMFSHWSQVWRIMYSSQKWTIHLANDMLVNYMAPEPIRVILRLAFPGLRRRMRPLPAEALAVVGTDDFFAAGADYRGDRNVTVKHVTGASHALICDPKAIVRLLPKIRDWFLQ